MTVRAAVLVCGWAGAAMAQDAVSLPATYSQGVIDCGSWSPVNRGQCTTTISRPDGGSWLSAASPLSIDAGVISCTGAADGVAGCITNGDQVLGAGTKILPGDVYMAGYVRAWVQGGAFIFDGRRSAADDGAEFTIRGLNAREGGNILDLRPLSQSSVFSVDNNGVVSITGPNTSFDGGAVVSGQIQEASGRSGHPLIVAYPGQSLTMHGKFNAPGAVGTNNLLLDGGVSPDGGYWAYAGRHGDVSLGAEYPRTAGMLLDVQNPISGTGAYTDKKFFVDYKGGFGNAGGDNLADFGPCPSELQIMAPAPGFQFRYGHENSAQLFAIDKQRYYVCLTAAWEQIPITDEVLVVQNGEAAPKSLDSGGSTCNAGTRTVTFAVAFSVAPAVFCSDITDYTQPCGTTSKTTTTATFACNGTDAINWLAVGLR